MKKIILTGSTSEIHISEVDKNQKIFVKMDGKLYGIVSREISNPHCGVYCGYGDSVTSHCNLYDLIRDYSESGYTFHVEN